MLQATGRTALRKIKLAVVRQSETRRGWARPVFYWLS